MATRSNRLIVLKKMILKFIKNEHFYSFINTLITDLLWDTGVGIALTHVIANQDFSKTALYALGYAVFRTFIRFIRAKYFPKPEPLMTADEIRNMNP